MAEQEPTARLRVLLTLDDEGPAQRLDAAALDAQVGVVLARHLQGGSVPAPRRAPTSRPLWWGAAAALAFGSAAAALWLGGATAPPPAPAPTPAPAPAPASASAPAPAPASAPAPAPAPAPATAPAPGTAPATAPAHASDLLARANKLRADGKYRAAEELYLKVAADPRDALSAHVALVAAGDLALQAMHEPTRARRFYRRALDARNDGPLAQEALLGVAATHRAEGQVQQERQALERLLEVHATGPAVTRARLRLGELNAAR
jgi:hypothetical protein